MTETRRVCRSAAAVPARLLALFVLVEGGIGVVLAEPPAVVDSGSIVRSLRPSSPTTRGLVVAPRSGGGADHNADHKITLDIRFANDSDRLTSAAYAQLAQLGTALSSPELAGARFLIAGHTSATGAAEHNRRLSESRARAVRGYLMERFHIAPGRLETAGFGSAHLLPDFPPSALQQRRVEISTLPPAS